MGIVGWRHLGTSPGVVARPVSRGGYLFYGGILLRLVRIPNSYHPVAGQRPVSYLHRVEHVRVYCEHTLLRQVRFALRRPGLRGSTVRIARPIVRSSRSSYYRLCDPRGPPVALRNTSLRRLLFEQLLRVRNAGNLDVHGRYFGVHTICPGDHRARPGCDNRKTTIHDHWQVAEITHSVLEHS
jgi:hypothetical protein